MKALRQIMVRQALQIFISRLNGVPFVSDGKLIEEATPSKGVKA